MDFTSWRTDPFRSTLLRAGEGQKKLLYHSRSNHGPSGQKRSSLAFSLFTLLLFQRVKLKLLWRFFCVFLQATTDSLDTWAAANIETQYTAGSRGQDCGFCRCAGITQTFLLHEKYTWIDFILLFFSHCFIGAGKTTTLVHYAEQRPDLRFLYVAFNSSVAQEAQRCFPTNVSCKTVHLLAFEDVGKMWESAEIEIFLLICIFSTFFF